MPDKVLYIPQASTLQHEAAEAEWHSRVTFQIGPQRYLFEFTGSVTRIPPASAKLISIDGRDNKPAKEPSSAESRSRESRRPSL